MDKSMIIIVILVIINIAIIIEDCVITNFIIDVIKDINKRLDRIEELLKGK